MPLIKCDCSKECLRHIKQLAEASLAASNPNISRVDALEKQKALSPQMNMQIIEDINRILKDA